MFDMSWQENAACQGTGVESWYTSDATPFAAELPLLRRICGRCPVLSECGNHAMANEQWGFWAGMTANERRLMRRRTAVSA